VPDTITLLSKPLFADRAFEWFFTCMNTLVVNKATLLRKLLAAGIAREFFMLSAEVYVKKAIFFESSIADHALKWFFIIFF